VLTLRNYHLYAVGTNGDIVSLGGIANFSERGARDMAYNRVKSMTKIQRALKHLVLRPEIIVQEWTADIDLDAV
jgi:hypothetical protein